MKDFRLHIANSPIDDARPSSIFPKKCRYKMGPSDQRLSPQGMKILIVDGDESASAALITRLTGEGFQVSAVTSGTKAIHSMLQDTPDLVILESTFVEEDPFSSAWDAFGIINWIKHTLPQAHIDIVLHTTDRSAKFQAHAKSCGVLALLQKTGNFDELVTVLRIAMAQRGPTV